MPRYVLEGEWSGYTSAQRKVVHREVVTSEKRASRLREMHAIRYTDGTSLVLFLREARLRERVEELNGYGSLIRKAEAQDGSVVNVSDLSR